MGITVSNNQGAPVTLKSTTVSGNEVPHHFIEPSENIVGYALRKLQKVSATIVRPANTTVYSNNDSISNHATAGSVVLQPLIVQRLVNKPGLIRRLHLSTNRTSGWGAVQIECRMWEGVAPTFSFGDNAAHTEAGITIGLSRYLGAATITLAQFADRAEGIATFAAGSEPMFGAVAALNIYWDMKIVSGTPTPNSGQSFTMTAEVEQS